MVLTAVGLAQLCISMEINQPEEVNSSVSAAEDKIALLPGQPQVSFQQFSGYVNVTVDDKQQKALFYYLVEAQTDPTSKPLVLWLNGGICMLH